MKDLERRIERLEQTKQVENAGPQFIQHTYINPDGTVHSREIREVGQPHRSPKQPSPLPRG